MPSGTTNFSLDIDDLIARALDKVGGEVTSGLDLRKARIALNLLLIDLANKGVPLAKLENRSFPLVAGVKTYTLPSDVNDILSVVVERDQVDIPVTRLSIAEYHKISNKEQKGLPTQFILDRQRVNGVVTLYLVPDRDTDVINYWCFTRIEDAGAYTDTPDMSFRYLPAMVFGLAYFCSFDRDGFDPSKRQELLNVYNGLLENAATEDRERASYQITPFNYKGR